MRRQRGFTVVEVLAVMWVLFCVAGAGFGIYVLWHFISKFW